MVAYLFTGSSTALDKAELLALAKGLDAVGLTTAAVEGLRENRGNESFRGMISLLYRTSITDVEQILSHFAYRSDRTAVNTTDDVRQQDCQFWDAEFETMLELWIRGSGHPDTNEVHSCLATILARNVTPQPGHYEDARELIDRSQSDALLRAKLLLTAVTGSERLPLASTWQLEVRGRAVRFSARCPNSLFDSVISFIRRGIPRPWTTKSLGQWPACAPQTLLYRTARHRSQSQWTQC